MANNSRYHQKRRFSCVVAEITQREKRAQQFQEASRPPTALNEAQRAWLHERESEFKALMGNNHGWTAAMNVVRERLSDGFLLTFFPDLSANEREHCLEPITLVCFIFTSQGISCAK
jgi:hypothetical protein